MQFILPSVIIKLIERFGMKNKTRINIVKSNPMTLMF